VQNFNDRITSFAIQNEIPGDTVEKKQFNYSISHLSIRMFVFIINFVSDNLSWFIIYVTLTVNYVNYTER